MTFNVALRSLEDAQDIVHESDEAEADGLPFSPWTRLHALERIVELRTFLEQARKPKEAA
jgi:hypothetical protein